LQFAQANAQTKNCKRACFANADKIVFKKSPNASKKIKIHRHTARHTQQTMTQKLNIDKAYSDTVDRRPAGNSGLAKGGLTCFVETFVVKQTFVLRMNFSAKNPALRQAANRYVQPYLNNRYK